MAAENRELIPPYAMISDCIQDNDLRITMTQRHPSTLAAYHGVVPLAVVCRESPNGGFLANENEQMDERIVTRRR